MCDNLRRQNEKAYEPSIVAIGPYHRGKAKLKQMEEHKLWYLQQLLDRKKNKSVNEYVMAIKELEERARNYYAETIPLKSDEFVEMMLLDGVFIIELFRKSRQVSQQIGYALRRDLILLENQLPFFILVRLFNMTKTDLDLEIIQIALTFLEFNAPEHMLESPEGIPINGIRHLLHLVHSCWCFKFAEMNRNATEKQSEFINSATELQESGCWCFKFAEMNRNATEKQLEFINSATELQESGCWCFKFAEMNRNATEKQMEFINSATELQEWGCWCFKYAEMNRNATEKQFEFINSATELQESGVQFKKAEERNLFDIKFVGGILEIPLLSILGEAGESFFTNLVAFELCPSYHSPQYVCDYAVFMKCLINSSEDVRILRHSGIIESWVGDDAELYSMWHKLFNITTTDTENFSYSQVFNDVNNHCKRRRNRWMANLKRNYFNSPWALISFLAATILLLLTVAQTIFSILSFGKGSFN
ncbi:unnamed protein product [Camellia sinensis]